jgi:hypothetical protein
MQTKQIIKLKEDSSHFGANQTIEEKKNVFFDARNLGCGRRVLFANNSI